MKRIIFVFVISRFHFSVMAIYIKHIRAVMPRCDESLKTVREGFSCPSNQLEWEERAKQMKCETLLQNCTDNNDFVYHCLINAWPNGTIEVCAPKQIIAGSYCAEFNKGGARVQTQYQSKCISCPYIYISSDSFKYQECYDLVRTSELSTKEAQTEKTSPIIPEISIVVENENITNSTDTENQCERRLQEGIIAATGVVICLVPSVILILFIIRRQHSKSAYTSTNTEVNPLKINKDLLKYLSKVAEEKVDSLRKKILESSFWNKYADSKPNDHEQIEVTGDFKEDMAIQAAVDVLNIMIYVVIRPQVDEEIVVCFLPKDLDAEKWMKISLDSNKTYKFLSDGDSRNEEAAQLTYDHVFSWKTAEAYTSTNTEVNKLKINKDLLKYLSKVAEEKVDSLSKKILESSFWNKYADSKPNDHEQIEVTGDFKEDMAIQAAVDVLNITIYVVIRPQVDKEIVVCFLPKDLDAEKWMKISLDSRKTCKFLSDGDSCNEEAAQLTYDHVFSWKTEEDGREMNSKEESTNVSAMDDFGVS